VNIHARPDAPVRSGWLLAGYAGLAGFFMVGGLAHQQGTAARYCPSRDLRSCQGCGFDGAEATGAEHYGWNCDDEAKTTDAAAVIEYVSPLGIAAST
jgi:hypothetical protein